MLLECFKMNELTELDCVVVLLCLIMRKGIKKYSISFHSQSKIRRWHLRPTEKYLGNGN